MPAYWWLYNMFALARNSWKFQNRDKRVHKVQNIEFEPFAPDTAEEIFHARQLLEIWTAKANLVWNGIDPASISEVELAVQGRQLLSGSEEEVNRLEVLGENMENSRRKVLILKPFKAYKAYGDMLHYYAVKNLMSYLNSGSAATLSVMCARLKGKKQRKWVNLGGQIMQSDDLDILRAEIGTGKLNTWSDVHKRYFDLWEKYLFDKQKHAFATLLELTGKDEISGADWIAALDKATAVQNFVCREVFNSRKKDFDNPFKKTTFRNDEEMSAALGSLEKNSFIIQVREETELFVQAAEELKKRTQT
jgi:hypothetical protein